MTHRIHWLGDVLELGASTESFHHDHVAERELSADASVDAVVLMNVL